MTMALGNGRLFLKEALNNLRKVFLRDKFVFGIRTDFNLKPLIKFKIFYVIDLNYFKWLMFSSPEIFYSKLHFL